MATLTNLNDVKRSLAIATNVSGTISYTANLDDSLINVFIQDASDIFSTETGNNYYGAQGTLTLNMTEDYVHHRKLFFRHDVLRSITRIENDGVGTLTDTDWVTLPQNGGGPYYGVELKTKYWSWSNSRLGAIKVIGALGVCASGQPPDRVHLAVTRLASYLYQTRDTKGSVQFIDKSSTSPDGTPDIVLQIIEREKRHKVFS